MKNCNLKIAMDECAFSIKSLSEVMCCTVSRAKDILNGIVRPTDAEMDGAIDCFDDLTLFHGMTYSVPRPRLKTKTRFNPASTVKTLMNSCVEGRTGEWDCSCEEGRESFESMYEHLQQLAEHFGLSVKGVKAMP